MKNIQLLSIHMVHIIIESSHILIELKHQPVGELNNHIQHKKISHVEHFNGKK